MMESCRSGGRPEAGWPGWDACILAFWHSGSGRAGMWPGCWDGAGMARGSAVGHWAQTEREEGQGELEPVLAKPPAAMIDARAVLSCMSCLPVPAVIGLKVCCATENKGRH